jgi:hypothetical protein
MFAFKDCWQHLEFRYFERMSRISESAIDTLHLHGEAKGSPV